MKDATPSEYFRLEEIQALLSFEKQQLSEVVYYVWHDQAEAGAQPHRFLYAIELVFDSGPSLLLSSGDDSEAIRVIQAEDLVDTAKKLQQIHGKAVIQRIPAGRQPQWRSVTGKSLENIRLARNEAGLYLNDAVLLDFGEHRVLVKLNEREGLLAGEF